MPTAGETTPGAPSGPDVGETKLPTGGGPSSPGSGDPTSPDAESASDSEVVVVPGVGTVRIPRPGSPRGARPSGIRDVPAADEAAGPDGPTGSASQTKRPSSATDRATDTEAAAVDADKNDAKADTAGSAGKADDTAGSPDLRGRSSAGIMPFLALFGGAVVAGGILVAALGHRRRGVVPVASPVEELG